jgi:ATP-dependent DNA helicase RecQ
MITLKQHGLIDKTSKAYELQETLKKERQQLKLHELEYKRLMDEIIANNVKHIGKYEIIDKVVQKKRFIISDKFREKWPDLFNRIAKVTINAALREITEDDLESVCGIDIVTKPSIIIQNGLNDDKSE